MKTKCSSCILTLGEKNRIRIYELLSIEGELNTSQLKEALNINQPTVSHHLGILQQQGLVSCTKKGKFKFYQLMINCPYYQCQCILK
ncbi:winged helix-turn-helix transcriptional regulator [bacterium]|nr:winged helix-turn-helix transcriptional regulator [bacterium]